MNEVRSRQETTKVIHNAVSLIRKRLRGVSKKRTVYINKTIRDICKDNNINEHFVRMILGGVNK